MFRLAHISDPHLGPLPRLSPADWLTKRIIGFLNWQGNRAHHHSSNWLDRMQDDLIAQNPDHIVVTGDLTNLAMAEEFSRSRTWLETLGTPDRVSVIPGNHDAYVPGALGRHAHHWSAFMTGDAGGDALHFPYLRRRSGVSIVGVSTAVAMPPWLAGGLVGKVQIRRLRDMLSDPAIAADFRIVLIHHPPQMHGAAPQKRLFDAERFRDVIRETGADLILHGHTHLATRADLDGPDGPVPVISVPSASNGPGGFRPAARYNVFDISREGTELLCHWSERGFDPVKGDLRTFRDQEPIARRPTGIAARS